MYIAIPGWRSRLVVDAYMRLKDGEGDHKAVVDSYVALAEMRGHTLPKNAAHIKQTIKDEVHRLSSDSSVYARWQHRRPDLFYKLERGRWGIRTTVVEQLHGLNYKEEDPELLAGVPPMRKLDNGLVVPNAYITPDQPIEDVELYVTAQRPIPGVMAITPGVTVVKIGMGTLRHVNELYRPVIRLSL